MVHNYTTFIYKRIFWYIR